MSLQQYLAYFCERKVLVSLEKKSKRVRWLQGSCVETIGTATKSVPFLDIGLFVVFLSTSRKTKLTQQYYFFEILPGKV